jgi:hypothetical protein
VGPNLLEGNLATTVATTKHLSNLPNLRRDKLWQSVACNQTHPKPSRVTVASKRRNFFEGATGHSAVMVDGSVALGAPRCQQASADVLQSQVHVWFLRSDSDTTARRCCDRLRLACQVCTVDSTAAVLSLVLASVR